MKLPPKLPSPDKYGNYYFGGPGRLPAIFPFKSHHPNAENVGQFTVLISPERGFVSNSKDRVFFKNVHEAFEVLRELV